MKPAILLFRIVVACLLTAGQAHSEGPEAEGLKIVFAQVRDSDATGDLLIWVMLKNVGDKDLTVLTKSLQIVLYDYTNKPPELSLELNSSAMFEDSLVVPSFYEFAPVTLRHGEVAQIRLPYQPSRKFERVVLVYDMLNDWSKRFKTWYGRVRTEPLQPMRLPQSPKAGK